MDKCCLGIIELVKNRCDLSSETVGLKLDGLSFVFEV